ncbi:hypothetical protein Tco_1259741, partial [Tanacetum coccineum]
EVPFGGLCKSRQTTLPSSTHEALLVAGKSCYYNRYHTLWEVTLPLVNNNNNNIPNHAGARYGVGEM